ncbi:MAG: HAD family acid phosphatase, partial [Bacteroidales bacterium]
MKKRKINVTVIILCCTLLISCNQRNIESNEPNNDHLIMAILYQQRSAEYEAICYQSFNLAKQIIDKKIQENKNNKKLAIITDIDETILDNSPYEASLVLNKTSYPVKW